VARNLSDAEEGFLAGNAGIPAGVKPHGGTNAALAG
jgi:hypothetical protein